MRYLEFDGDGRGFRNRGEGGGAEGVGYVLALVVLIVSLTGCGATWRHTTTLDDYQGQVLPIPGPGEARLEIESEYDVAVRNVVATHGGPDYILVESLDLLKMIYLEDDRVLIVDRSDSFTGAVSITEPIPDDVVAQFRRDDRTRLEAIRSSEGTPSGAAPTAAASPTSVSRAPTPSPRATQLVRTPRPTTKPRPKRVPPVAQSSAARPSLSERVYLDLEIDLASPRRPAIRGETNLPDGTVLMTSVEGKDSGFYGQDKARVSNGRFSSGPFGPLSGLAPGEYEADVTMPLPRLQDASVRAVIGERGEKLKGKLVSPDSLGATVSAAKAFRVGNTGERGAAESQRGRDKHEARAIYDDLATLAEAGRSMQPLRDPGDLGSLRECGIRMRENQEKAASLWRRAEALPRSVGAYLVAAAISMDRCVSCLRDAIESCELAESELREAAAAIR